MRFDLSVPTDLIMNVLDYNCAKMQQVKVLRENVDFYIFKSTPYLVYLWTKKNHSKTIISNYILLILFPSHSAS